MFRAVRAAAVGLISLAVVAPVSASPASASTSDLTFTTSSITDRSRAYARVNNYAYPKEKGAVFKIRVDMRAGETRLIKSKLQAKANPNMTDSLVVVGHKLVCRPMNVDDQTYFTITSRNIKRGVTDTSYNSFFFKAPKTGAYVCETLIEAGRPKKPKAGSPDPGRTTNWSTITDSSWLMVGAPRSFAKQSFDYKAASPVMHPTSTTRTFNRLVFRPNKSTMRFHQTIYLTSCTAPSGSMDPVTREYACKSSFSTKANASIYAVSTVKAYDKWGKNCKTYNRIQQRIYVPVDVHHKQELEPFHVDLSPSCMDSIEVSTKLGSVKGAPIMVHKQGMILRTD